MTPLESRYFEGRQAGEHSWVCQRIEINALSVAERAPYIERKLREAGAIGRVVPPDNELQEMAKDMAERRVADWVEEAILRMFPREAIARRIRDEFMPQVPLSDARQWVDETQVNRAETGWRQAVDGQLARLLTDKSAALDRLVREAVRAALAAPPAE